MYNTAATIKETIQGCRRFPLLTWTLTKEDSMRKWSEKHTNYIQYKGPFKGLGAGVAGCLLSPFFSHGFSLCNLNESLSYEQSRHLCLCIQHSHRIPSHYRWASTWQIRISELRRQEKMSESHPSGQSGLTLVLSATPSRLQAGRGRQAQPVTTTIYGGR